MLKKLFAPVILGIVFLAPSVASHVPMIPIEDFFRKPERIQLRLSPNGQALAWLAPWKDRLNIHVQTIGEKKIHRLTSVTHRDIPGFAWANDRQLVYIQDDGGDENFHLYLASLESKEVKDLTPYPNVRAQLIDDLEDIPDEMLIAMNQRNPQVFDVYRLTLSTGEKALIAENPGNITSWITDHEGKLRAAIATDGVNETLLYRSVEKEDFQPLITTDFRTSVYPLAFTFDNRNLLLASNLKRDKSALVEYDPREKKEMRILFEHPEVDIQSLLYSRHRKVLEAVTYVTDKPHYHFLDSEREKLQKFLEGKFPENQVRLVDRSRDESRMLVVVASDRSAGTYYLYEAESQKLSKIADIMPWLNADHLAPMKPIAFSSRDGVQIHGYLTLPADRKAKTLPVVLNPHGGPSARDYWGFNPQIQFLANRGYAVLQINFRGSTGYGRQFWEAGFQQWGRGIMQNDLTDGVQWLIDEKIADADKIAIYGASYGGYAALAGLAFTPDLYAAGVSYVGPSNLFTLLESIPPYWEPMRQQLYEQIGHPEKDRDFLKSISPFFHAEAIAAPLLVAQGANDPRVKKAESDQIVAAMKERGIDVPYLVKEDEGHGFRNQENQFEFYRILEAFLAKHLGGKSTTDAAVLETLE